MRAPGVPGPRGPATVSAVVAAVLVAVLAALVSPAPAQALPTQDAGETAARVPAVQVIAQNLEVGPTGSFSVYLRVTDAPAGSDVAVDLYNRIADADSLAASTTTDPTDARATFDPVPLADREASSQQTGFTISLYARGLPRPAGAWAYRLDEPGVYPLRIRLRDGDANLLTSIVTYLVRAPAADAEPVRPARVALLTNIAADPTPTGTSTGEAAVAEGFTTDVSATLGQFAKHAQVPASFAVSPETAERLDADPERADLLAALSVEIDRPGRELLGASYVPLDPAPLVNEGLADEIQNQADLGRRTLTSLLGAAGTDTWLVDGAIDVASVDALRAAGVAHLVLPATAVGSAPAAAPVLLPSASGVNAVTTGLFDLTSEPPPDPVLAAYQLLGRLAAVGSLTPTGAGLVVRIEPAAVSGKELATLLAELALPTTFLAPTTVSQLFQEVPTTTDPVASLTTPLRSDLGLYPDRLRQARQMRSSWGSMLTDPAAATAEFERPLARSADRRLGRGQQLRMVNDVRTTIQRRFDAVTVPESDRVTLGARDAQFPLPITSTLDEPVKVVITLDAPDRLSFPRNRIETTLQDERTTVQIPVRTRATGDTPLRITVRTPDGAVILDESQYTIRSTAVSGVGLMLTAGAGGFLAIWWGRHWLRHRKRRRARHARSGGAPPEPPGPVGGDDLFVDPSI